ncbi:MAG: hypothetical protein BGO70_01290 [Bacteroidetes bacterium 43-93]|uniref:hypothetical protein n=1 Tax=uncultured Dysgonomonas sp. TaxID=206096 RepID=UPI00092A163A|nr:hypothetical protein [uncultured Dysgonomonas sp.]OJW96344.1 MAG: hypothetical protein BGO70_01290 [Bacteroidetes bacterium 43-93]
MLHKEIYNRIFVYFGRESLHIMQPDQKMPSTHGERRHRHRRHSERRKKRKIKRRNTVLVLAGIIIATVVLALWLSAKTHINNNNEHQEIVIEAEEEG